MSSAGGRRWRRLLGAVTVAGCLVAVVAGSSASSASSPRPATLRALFASFPDYLDPQLSYTNEGWNAMYDVYVPLLTFRHADGGAGNQVVPGLARSLPTVSDGGRTYTLFLRRGLKYSDGTRVRASDFEFAVKRIFRLHSGASPFYSVIVGASKYSRTRRGGISGITADNATGRIVIRLSRPSGTFTQLLAVPFAAPVPPTTPMHDLSLRPPPATGPYAILPLGFGDGWTYVRNPAWRGGRHPLPEVPRGFADRIEVEVVRDPEKEVQEVLSGEADWMQNPPPANRFAVLRRRFEGTRLRVDPVPSTYYFWMNTRKPPFDDLRVRQAANYAVDTSALEAIYGGQLIASHQVLPPGMPGYEAYDLYPYDLATARRLVAEADPADRRITVWTDNETPNDEAGIYFAGQLRKIGFRVELKALNAFNYFTVIGRRKTPNLDAGWSDWFADFPHPDDWFRPLLRGASILPFNNGNFARIGARRLDAQIEALKRAPLDPAVESAYAALDRAFMERAPWVPYGTRVLSTFVSSAVDLDSVVFSPMFGADMASFQFKSR